ncbi:MAG: SpoIIE family protein phosphatase [Bacteroidaceae bacterium]|nr:SpoIIE family protein phosphatase [Bacteroidaceae bacterium]
MKARNNSLAKRLSKGIVANLTTFLALAFFIIGAFSYHIMADTSERMVANMLEASARKIELNLRPAETVTQNVAWMASKSLDHKDHLYYITRSTIQNNPSVVGCAIALRSGYYEGEHFFSPYSYLNSGNDSIISIQLGNENYDYFNLDWYRIPATLRQPVWSDPYYDNGGINELISTYSYPLIDENNEFQGIVTADISMEWLTDVISSAKPYANSEIMLVSKNGTFIATDIENITQGETLTAFAEQSDNEDIVRITEKMLAGESGMERYDIGHGKHFAIFSPLSNGWSVCITCSYHDVLKRSTQMLMFIALFGIVAMTVLFLFCQKTIKKLAQPLMDFSNAAGKVAAGDFDVVLPEINTNDEIGQLRNSFAGMQSSLKSYMSELQQTTAKKERIENELHIAHEIQRVMSPQNFPKNDKVNLYATIIPAREVGGDLYDFSLTDDSLFISVGDVSGKGIPAAMFMALTCSSLRITSSLKASIGQTISKINDAVSKDNETGMFVTLFAGRIDLNTGMMTYCNGGHNPMVVVEPGKAPYFLDQKANLTVGIMEDFNYQEQTVTFPKGTILILYTDGVTEAEAADKSQYGEQRLLKWASEIPFDSDAADIEESLLKSVRNFTGDNEQNDDITIMAIKL